MSQGKQRTLQDIEAFIRSKHLSEKLRRDLKNLRLVKEADVECAVYYHLRRYIGEDPKWRVLARKHVRRIGRSPDLVIFKGAHPAIVVELKWNKANIGKKDRKTLYQAITELKVQKAYWLSTVYSNTRTLRLRKRPEEKYVLHRVVVGLGLTGRKLHDWKKKRDQFGKRMAFGKAHKSTIGR